MRKDIKEKKEEIVDWIKEKKSKAFICRQLKCKPETLNFWLSKMEIDYKGNQGFGAINKKKTVLEYLNSDSLIKSDRLKKKLIEEGYKEHKCEECKLTEWNGDLIPIELHHIDGDRFNNEIDNLQILCPNCHAQTDNYRNKNIK